MVLLLLRQMRDTVHVLNYLGSNTLRWQYSRIGCICNVATSGRVLGHSQPCFFLAADLRQRSAIFGSLLHQLIVFIGQICLVLALELLNDLS